MINRSQRVLHNVIAMVVFAYGAIVVFSYDGPLWLAFVLWAVAALFSSRGAELVTMSRSEYERYTLTGSRSTDRPRHPF